MGVHKITAIFGTSDQMKGDIIMVKKAFTLIELLVVIAIIALLLAILLPSLNAVKRIAQGVVCMTNTRQLSLGWTLYTKDFDDRMPNSITWQFYNTGSWVKHPIQSDGLAFVWPFVEGTDYYEDRIRGIKAGALYPYIENHEVYHCKGDRRFTESEWRNYISYTMASPIGPDSSGVGMKKVTEISIPSDKYIFVEESDTRHFFVEGWGLGTEDRTDGRTDGWWDGLAIWHNGSSTFGFADGHSDKHKWVNESTIKRSNLDLSGGGTYGYEAYTDGPREDLDWLQAHWPARGAR